MNYSIMQLLEIIMLVVGKDMVIYAACMLVVVTFSSLVVVMHVMNKKYQAKKRHIVKPGYVYMNDNIRTLSTTQIDAYEQID